MNRVREFRVARDWTQVKLAKRAKVSFSTISLLERELRGASPLVRGRLARALEVPEDVLFDGEPRKKAS